MAKLNDKGEETKIINLKPKVVDFIGKEAIDTGHRNFKNFVEAMLNDYYNDKQPKNK